MRASCLAEYINVASEELLVLPPRVDSVPHPDTILSVVIKELLVSPQVLVHQLAHFRNRQYNVESNFLECGVHLTEDFCILLDH